MLELLWLFIRIVHRFTAITIRRYASTCLLSFKVLAKRRLVWSHLCFGEIIIDYYCWLHLRKKMHFQVEILFSRVEILFCREEILFSVDEILVRSISTSVKRIPSVEKRISVYHVFITCKQMISWEIKRTKMMFLTYLQKSFHSLCLALGVFQTRFNQSLNVNKCGINCSLL